MITNINEILVEWAYRTRDGLPDPKSMSHQIILEGILREFGWNIEQRGELLKNLQEAKAEPKKDQVELDDAGKEEVKKLGLKWLGQGYGKSKEAGITHKNEDGKLVKVGEEPEDGGKADKPGDITAEPDAFDRFADEPSVQDKEKADATAAKKAALVKKTEKLIAVKQQPKSKILRDKNGRILTINGKDKRLTKGVVTGNSDNYTEDLGKPSDDEFDDKTPDKNKMGHPGDDLPKPKADLDNDPAMIAILEALESPPYKFPKKYLKLISRMLNSHGGVAAVTKLTNYIKGGGAGQINSQAGELLAVIGSALPPKEREEFFNLIEKHLDSQMDPDAEPPTAPTEEEWNQVVSASPAKARKEALKELQAKYPHLKINETGIRKRLEKEPPKGPTGSQTDWKKQNNLVVNHGWLHAAKQNCKAIDKYIKKNYPPPCTVENSAWDTKEDFEALGNSDYKKNKGHSSDQYLKVNCEGESHLVEVSLKKDGNIRLSNSSPSKLFDYPNLTDEEIKEFSKNANPDPKKSSLHDADGDGKITTKDVSEAEFSKRQNKRYIDAVKDKVDEFCKALEDGTVNAHSDLGELIVDGKCNKQRVNELLSGDGNARKRNKLFRDFLLLSEDGKKVIEENEKDAEQMIANIVNAMSYDPLKTKMLNGIREALPLKSLFDGEEMMALDDISFDRDTMQECFGVDSWDELQENLIIDNSNPKKPFIIYELRNSEGKVVKSFKIAKISCRQDGDNYGGIRLDLDLEKEFEDAVRECDEKVHGKSE